MTARRSFGGTKLRAATLLAISTLALGACFSPPVTPPATTTTTAAPTTTTSTSTTSTSTTTSTTTTTVAPLPTITVPSSTPIALTVHAGAPYAYANIAYSMAASANKRLFIYVCKEDASSPTFNYNSSCSNDSELTVNPSSATSGTIAAYPIFHGPEPTGDIKWGIYGSGETAGAGYTKYTTGYIRFTVDSPSNVTDQVFAPFTFNVIP